MFDDDTGVRWDCDIGSEHKWIVGSETENRAGVPKDTSWLSRI